MGDKKRSTPTQSQSSTPQKGRSLKDILLEPVKFLKNTFLRAGKFLKNTFLKAGKILKNVFVEGGKRAGNNLKSAFHWLLFSSVIAVLPLILAASHDWVATYSWENLKEKYAADFFLVTFAVAANLLGLATSKKFKIFSFGISFLSALFCISQYSYLHNTPDSINVTRLDTLLTISVVCLVLNSAVGFFAELFSKIQQQAQP